MKPSETLRAARELITPERAWIQGEYAFDIDLQPVGPMSPRAVSWGVDGAISKAVGRFPWHDNQYVKEAIGFFSSAVKEKIVWRWADDPSRTRAEVLDAFDRAVALAEAEGR